MSKSVSANVRNVARILRGRSIVVIGGQARRDAAEALKKAFDLKEVIWIATKGHESYKSFTKPITRPDVAVVGLLIRLSSHSFGQVQHTCKRHQKPLVRLPAGYNPEQVAAQILAQTSLRLSRNAG